MFTELKLICLLSAAATTGGPVVSLELLTQFDQRPPNAVVAAMAQEMGALYRDVPVSIGWHELSGYQSRVVGPRIVFIYFKGGCRAPRLPPRQFVEGQALGGISRVDGRMLPVITVDCERTSSYIWQSMRGAERADGDGAYGRALGRVIAHELYHYLTGTTKHTRTVLFRASISAGALLAREVSFTPAELADLRKALARATPARGTT